MPAPSRYEAQLFESDVLSPPQPTAAQPADSAELGNLAVEQGTGPSSPSRQAGIQRELLLADDDDSACVEELEALNDETATTGRCCTSAYDGETGEYPYSWQSDVLDAERIESRRKELLDSDIGSDPVLVNEWLALLNARAILRVPTPDLVADVTRISRFYTKPSDLTNVTTPTPEKDQTNGMSRKLLASVRRSLTRGKKEGASPPSKQTPPSSKQTLQGAKMSLSKRLAAAANSTKRLAVSTAARAASAARLVCAEMKKVGVKPADDLQQEEKPVYVKRVSVAVGMPMPVPDQRVSEIDGTHLKTVEVTCPCELVLDGLALTDAPPRNCSGLDVGDKIVEVSFYD